MLGLESDSPLITLFHSNMVVLTPNFNFGDDLRCVIHQVYHPIEEWEAYT